MGAKKVGTNLPPILEDLEKNCPTETLHVGVFDDTWKDRGICLQVDGTDKMYFAKGEKKISAIICAPCPVKHQCVIWGLMYREEGTWGGTNESERRQYVEEKPEYVMSLIEKAKSLRRYLPALDPFGGLIHPPLSLCDDLEEEDSELEE